MDGPVIASMDEHVVDDARCEFVDVSSVKLAFGWIARMRRPLRPLRVAVASWCVLGSCHVEHVIADARCDCTCCGMYRLSLQVFCCLLTLWHW